MNTSKQMCWCFKVSLKVFGNLAGRIYRDVFDEAYKMCSGCAKRRNDEIACAAGAIRSSEETFFQNVDRKTSELILRDKQNGTFVIRPSENTNTLGILSVIQTDKVYHLIIRQRDDNLIALGTKKINEKCFRDLDGLINYYISNYLILYSDGNSCRALLLPYTGPSE